MNCCHMKSICILLSILRICRHTLFFTATNGGDQQINCLKSKVYYIQKCLGKTEFSKQKILLQVLEGFSLISQTGEHFWYYRSLRQLCFEYNQPIFSDNIFWANIFRPKSNQLEIFLKHYCIVISIFTKTTKNGYHNFKSSNNYFHRYLLSGWQY